MAAKTQGIARSRRRKIVSEENEEQMFGLKCDVTGLFHEITNSRLDTYYSKCGINEGRQYFLQVGADSVFLMRSKWSTTESAINVSVHIAPISRAVAANYITSS